MPDLGWSAAASRVFHDFVGMGTTSTLPIRDFFLFRDGAPQHGQLANQLYGGRIQFIGQAFKQLPADASVIFQQPDLDQAMCGQGLVGFLAEAGGQALSAHQDHRLQMVGLGAAGTALLCTEA